jgi:predicted dehydrogenase
VTNNGIHLLDIVRWSLKLGAPKKIAALGGRYAIQDGREIPDTLEAMWEFEGPVIAIFTQLNTNEAPSNVQVADLELRGTKGTLYLHNDRFEVVPERNSDVKRYRPSPVDRSSNRGAWMRSRKAAMEPKVVRGNALADREHVMNFLECVRSRAQCNAPMQEGYLSTSTCILASIAVRTGAMLTWDGRTTGHAPADALLDYKYRRT